MKKSNVFSDFLASFSLIVFIISSAVVFTLFFKPLYFFDISFLDIPAYSGIEKNEIMHNYNALINYNSVFYTGELVFPSLPMSLTGLVHFAEVKNIFSAIQIICIISFFSSAILCVIKIKKRSFKFLRLTVYLAAFIIGAFGLISLINWDWFFLTFHKILFKNSFWAFNSIMDPIITILPSEFFTHCAIMIIVIVAISLVMLLLIYRHLKKRFA